MATQALLIVLGALAGLIAGSFIGALVQRWPRGQSVMRGRSQCDRCGQTLRARELVPLLSFALLKGRCRSCRAPIAPNHLAAELAAAMVGATAFAAAPPAIALGSLVLGWGLVALALLDVEHFWLPDRLTLPLAGSGLFVSAAGMGIAISDSLIGIAAGYGALVLIGALYKALRGRVGIGGGDAKLLAAIGAWIGWQLLPFALLMASLIGLSSVLLRRVRGARIAASERLPLGAMLAVAAWALWLLRQGVF